jgi:hypothetical protein
MESLMDIAILSGEDIGTYCTFSSIKYIIIIPSAAVQASYALQRAIGYLTNSDLSRLRCDALFFSPLPRIRTLRWSTLMPGDLHGHMVCIDRPCTPVR